MIKRVLIWILLAGAIGGEKFSSLPGFVIGLIFFSPIVLMGDLHTKQSDLPFEGHSPIPGLPYYAWMEYIWPRK